MRVWTNFEQAVTAETSTVLVNESVINGGTPISLLRVEICLTCLFVTMILSFGLSFGFKQIVACYDIIKTRDDLTHLMLIPCL